VTTPVERQHALLELLWTACQRPLDFTEREQAREFFTRLGCRSAR